MEGNVIQINGGTTLNVDVSVNNVIYVENIVFGILLYVVVKIEKKLLSIMDDLVITFDEITKKQKLFQKYDW